jgi:hypothetical protein
MARGDMPNRQPGDPGEGRRGGPGARQREVLAQFEAAIAGMDTRQIQLGLRHLLASGMRGANVADSAREAEVAEASRVTEVARGASVDRRADETRVADEPGEAADEPGEADEARGTGVAEQDRDDGDEGDELPPVVAFGAMATVRTDPSSPPSGRPWADLDGAPGPVAQLLGSVRTPSARRQMERLISEAELHRTDTVGIATMARMVWPYSWLLDRVGDHGIKLTDAGHLPPTEVTAVIEDLNLAAEGVPQVSRENQASPVVQLRESAQATGLVRRHRGRLVLTTDGSELRRDPAALWWHLAGELPLRSAAISEVAPGMILLACVAARFTDTLDLTVARMLTAIGWLNSDGSPLTSAEAAAASYGTYSVLRRVGALPSTPGAGQPPHPAPEGVAFARAALSTWPGVVS